MVKVLFFLLLVFGIMFYPLIISGNVNYKSSVKLKPKKVADVTLENGKFFIYNNELEKKGDFKVLDIYKKGYVAFYLNAFDVIKNEKYRSYKTVFKNKYITGYDVWYKNKDIELKTKKAIYNKDTKILNGGKFELYSQDFRGFGGSFKIDNKKDLYAENITYYIKVEK